MNVLRVILSGVAAKDPGQTPYVILSEATLVAKSKDLGGPAFPRRHALFYGVVPGLSPVPHLVKPSLASLAVIPAHHHVIPARHHVIPARHHVIPAQAGISLLVPRVSALACNDRCRETLEEAA